MDAKLRYKAKKIKIVFFDIDDTLRVKNTGYIPESIQQVFKSLKEKGILIGIASGRTPYGLVPEIKALKPDFFAMINGSYVEDAKGQVVYHQPMPQNLVESVLNWAKEIGIEYGMLGSQKGTLSARTDRISQVIDLIYEGLETNPTFYKENDIYQLLTFEKDGHEVELPEELQAELRSVRWDAISSDIVLKGSSKATGVAKVVEKLGLKPENVLVFGDGLNDIELFDYAGISIAMGHSHPELQKHADYITKKVEEDGIFDALEKLGMVEKEKYFPQLDLENVTGPVAHIKTNHGKLTVKLFPEIAPKTVANFVALSKDGYYDGIIFHRIIKDFMIQGGDPTGTGMGGESIYGTAFEDEFSMEAFNLRGALSMANAGPNTNGSQFFIVQNQNFPYNAKELERGGWPKEVAEAYVKNGGTPHLDQRHTVFGHLVDEESFVVLDAIAAVATDSADRPHEDVVIETIEIED
ncbi:TPA: Cof-type HAD-IIB family hydrolase [Streptococcus suis]|uniref:bifunctional Cof-type HAD-IIB family hydrolase/peptidylprolyl isomerase n=1 Tax=Streptococcus suis TaxID=1307 RepID=UPI001C9DCE0B|nr:Cof-type HAD-IIB family hydrolase [Streptococcus suis]QZS61370.1 Cof-type HAD-IIB family hydrolase [Streptococcus suis]HEM3462237.1 Cof-type HAD-IIB family hydrolase [Streptococcus suis]